LIPTDLRGFLRAIDAAGELRRVRVPVDPRLEITEIVQRVLRAGGPALLFERVEGSDLALAINLFGSRRRIEIALGRPPAEIGESLFRLAKDLNPPRLRALLAHRRELLAIRGMKPRVRRGGPVREVVEEPDLGRIPVLTCWPGDGGPFVTFPLVHTRSPRDGALNVGIYRMHVFGPRETGLHWQIAKGGGYHYVEAEELGQALPVAVALGGDPVLMLAAMMPLPEGLSEAAFAGLLRGRPVVLSRGETVDLDVPAAAELVLEGTVAPGERRAEGPFGDHFGHYSAAAPFPVFRVRKVFRRRDAIYPATVVGKPPQEDGVMGNAVQELLGPLIRLPHPEVRALWSFEETGFHHLLVASVEERFAKEAMRAAFGLLGQGQLGLTKVLVTVAKDVDCRDLDAVLDAIARHFDPAEDFLLLPRVPFDTLDFTSYTLNVGSKMILDATPSRKGPADRAGGSDGPVSEDPDVPATTGSLPDLTTIDRRIAAQARLGSAILAITVRDPADARGALSAALRALPGPGGGGTPAPPKIVAAVSPDVPLDDRRLLLWGIFTRFDPARDVFFERSELVGAWAVHRGRMAVDATWKRGYPAALEMDPAVVKKVDRRWAEYGLDVGSRPAG
jgi:4-hydroxy-3-polyprenylbenzoate decarboxylase